MSDTQTPIENNSVFHEAQGNLAFLLSVIRCGERLSPDEEANVRRVIERLGETERNVKAFFALLDIPYCSPKAERLSANGAAE